MSLKEYDLKVLNVKKGGLSGRCQRVSSVVTESDGSENVAPQQKTVEPLQLVDYPAETKSKKKPNLSKYIDDNIRNFDLLTKRRDRSSTSSDSTTHSNGSTNSSFEKEVSNLSSAKENVLTNNQVHPKVVPDTTNAAPKAVETPSKRNKSKTSKFSIDAVESPKAPVAAVPALASVLARSSSILARTKKSAQPPPATAVPAVSIEPISMTPVAIDPSVVQERRNSRSHSGALYWHDTDVPAAAITTTAAADLTTGSCNNTATNTNAPTVAFKKTASVNANEPSKVASEQEKELAAIEVSRSKKVSFNASAGAVGVAAAASSVGALEPAPACPSSQAKSARRSASGAAADAHHNHSSHGHGNSNCNSGGISSSGSRATPSRTPSSASVSTGNSSAIALSQQQQSHQQSSSLQAAGGGILGDPARSVELNGRHYIRLNVLGKGGSSCVYRIIGAEDGQVNAYKRVEVKESEDMDAVFDNYANEIALLRRLSSAAQTTAPGSETAENGAAAGGGAVSTESSAVVAAGVTGAQSRIIELVDFEVRRDERYIAMILEAGDIDLAKVLQQKNTARSANPSNSTDGAGIQHLLDPFFARMVWREMLEAVDHIHQHRIVHGKPISGSAQHLLFCLMSYYCSIFISLYLLYLIQI